MAAPIGPGDFVECIGTQSADSPNLGRVFLCTSVTPGLLCTAHWERHGSINVAGLPAPHREGWSTCAFRPVYRPKQELIESLKAPPIRQTQDA